MRSVYRDDERRRLRSDLVLQDTVKVSPNEISLHDRFRQDVYYVDNMSCARRQRVFKTIATVLGRKGVYESRQVAGKESRGAGY